MLRSRITVDLPSHESLRRKTMFDGLKELFGGKTDLRTGRDAVTMSAFSLLEGLVDGFLRAKVKDVISFVVDKKLVYVDAAEVDDDLLLVREAAEQKGVLNRPFKEMHLVLSHRADGRHTLMDVRIKHEVMQGDEEMAVDLSARIDDLRIGTGESAKDYADRVRLFMQDAATIEGHRAALEEFTRALATTLQGSLVGARATAHPATVQIVRPDARGLGRLRGLGFGDKVEEPRYRPVPALDRRGAYAEPFVHYYYDPYYDYMNWVMLNAMWQTHAWSSPHVHIVDTGGHMLAPGTDASDAMQGWVGQDAVSYGSDGGLQVSDAIPAATDNGGDSGTWGDGDASGSGASSGSGDADSGGGFWGGGDDTGGSSDSASSCSSSDSGSSCSSSSSCGGSSCGGGGD